MVSTSSRWQRQRGQTVVEYLLLLAMVVGVTFLLMAVLFSNLATKTIEDIRSVLQNVVRNGEVGASGRVAQPGEKAHPGHPDRLQPRHF